MNPQLRQTQKDQIYGQSSSISYAKSRHSGEVDYKRLDNNLEISNCMIWCQQCQHGGHAGHIIEWFEF